MSLLESIYRFLFVLPDRKEDPVSDIAAETPPPDGQEDGSKPADDPRVAELEAENARLREQLAAAPSFTSSSFPTANPSAVVVPPPAEDTSGRVDELIRQGLSEQDANDQAAYEARLRADRA